MNLKKRIGAFALTLCMLLSCAPGLGLSAEASADAQYTITLSLPSTSIPDSVVKAVVTDSSGTVRSSSEITYNNNSETTVQYVTGDTLHLEYANFPSDAATQNGSNTVSWYIDGSTTVSGTMTYDSTVSRYTADISLANWSESFGLCVYYSDYCRDYERCNAESSNECMYLYFPGTMAYTGESSTGMTNRANPYTTLEGNTKVKIVDYQNVPDPDSFLITMEIPNISNYDSFSISGNSNSATFAVSNVMNSTWEAVNGKDIFCLSLPSSTGTAAISFNIKNLMDEFCSMSGSSYHSGMYFSLTGSGGSSGGGSTYSLWQDSGQTRFYVSQISQFTSPMIYGVMTGDTAIGFAKFHGQYLSGSGYMQIYYWDGTTSTALNASDLTYQGPANLTMTTNRDGTVCFNYNEIGSGTLTYTKGSTTVTAEVQCYLPSSGFFTAPEISEAAYTNTVYSVKDNTPPCIYYVVKGTCPLSGISEVIGRRWENGSEVYVNLGTNDITWDAVTYDTANDVTYIKITINNSAVFNNADYDALRFTFTNNDTNNPSFMMFIMNYDPNGGSSSGGSSSGGSSGSSEMFDLNYLSQQTWPLIYAVDAMNPGWGLTQFTSTPFSGTNDFTLYYYDGKSTTQLKYSDVVFTAANNCITFSKRLTDDDVTFGMDFSAVGQGTIAYTDANSVTYTIPVRCILPDMGFFTLPEHDEAYYTNTITGVINSTDPTIYFVFTDQAPTIVYTSMEAVKWADNNEVRTTLTDAQVKVDPVECNTTGGCCYYAIHILDKSLYNNPDVDELDFNFTFTSGGNTYNSMMMVGTTDGNLHSGCMQLAYSENAYMQVVVRDSDGNVRWTYNMSENDPDNTMDWDRAWYIAGDRIEVTVYDVPQQSDDDDLTKVIMEVTGPDQTTTQRVGFTGNLTTYKVILDTSLDMTTNSVTTENGVTVIPAKDMENFRPYWSTACYNYDHCESHNEFNGQTDVMMQFYPLNESGDSTGSTITAQLLDKDGNVLTGRGQASYQGYTKFSAPATDGEQVRFTLNLGTGESLSEIRLDDLDHYVLWNADESGKETTVQVDQPADGSATATVTLTLSELWDLQQQTGGDEWFYIAFVTGTDVTKLDYTALTAKRDDVLAAVANQDLSIYSDTTRELINNLSASDWLEQIQENEIHSQADIIEHYNYLEEQLNRITSGTAQTAVVVGTVSDPAGTEVLSGGGNYASDETISLSAGSYSGYTFLGWYDANGVRVSTTRNAEVKAANYSGTAAFTAKYEANAAKTLTVTVDGHSKIYYKIAGMDKFDEDHVFEKGTDDASGTFTIGSYAKGSVVTLRAWENLGYTFCWWQDANGRILSYNEVINVKVTSSRTLTAHFEPTVTGQKFLKIRFLDLNGKELTSEIVYESLFTDRTTYELTSTLADSCRTAYAGMTFDGWRYENGEAFTGKTITVNDLNDSTITIQAAYTTTSTGLTVKVTGGWLTCPYTDGEHQTFAYNDVVTVEATESLYGKYFSGWYIGEDKVSDSIEYAFRITEDTELTAKYEGDAVLEAAPITTLSVTDRTTEAEQSVFTMYNSWDVPEGYTLLEAGILYTPSDTAELTLENAETDSSIRRRISRLTTARGLYSYTLTLTGTAMDNTYRAAGYITYEDPNGDVVTAYTGVVRSFPQVYVYLGEVTAADGTLQQSVEYRIPDGCTVDNSSRGVIAIAADADESLLTLNDEGRVRYSDGATAFDIQGDDGGLIVLTDYAVGQNFKDRAYVTYTNAAGESTTIYSNIVTYRG